MKVESVGDLTGFFEHLGSPLGGSPVVGEAIVDQPAETTHLLLKGCVVVGAVSKNQIHIFHLEALETSLATFNDTLAR